MKCLLLSSGKNKKTNNYLLSAEIAYRVVKVNNLVCFCFLLWNLSYVTIQSVTKSLNSSALTLKALIATTAADTLKYIFVFYFSEKIQLDISCELFV